MTILGRTPSLDWVWLDDPELLSEGRVGDVQIWRSPGGDAVGVYFFDLPPNLPNGLPSEAEFFAAFSAEHVAPPLELVEGEACLAAGVPSVKMIAKSPQDPFGHAYLGSIIVPFRDVSWVVKAQCEEHGDTGLLEALLWDRTLSEAQAHGIEAESTLLPEEPGRSDLDHLFPDHPAVRVRVLLLQMLRGIRMDERTAGLSRFTLPWGSTAI